MAIDVGLEAFNGTNSRTQTVASKTNPANNSGTIAYVETWLNASGTTSVASFSASGNDMTTRDSEDLGSVSSGSKQTFSGLDMTIVAGDYIGIYCGGGSVELNIFGAGDWTITGDFIPCTNETFTSRSDESSSIYGTSAPAVDILIDVPLADTVNGAGIVPAFVRDMSFAVPLAGTVNAVGVVPVIAIEPIINVPLATIDCAGIIPTMVRDMKPAIPLADTVNGAGIVPALVLDMIFAIPLADTINGAVIAPTLAIGSNLAVPLATTIAIVAISPAIQPPRPWVISRSGLDDDYDTTHTRLGLDDDYSAVRPRSGKSSY